jgi:hypothetical protein
MFFRLDRIAYAAVAIVPAIITFSRFRRRPGNRQTGESMPNEDAQMDENLNSLPDSELPRNVIDPRSLL